jgi:hypothetical protein
MIDFETFSKIRLLFDQKHSADARPGRARFSGGRPAQTTINAASIDQNGDDLAVTQADPGEELGRETEG